MYMGADWAAGIWSDDYSINVVSDCNHVVGRPFCEPFNSGNINVLELWPILVGLKRWASTLKNRSLMVFTDNTQVMFMLINGCSSNLTCMNWVREFFLALLNLQYRVAP